MSQRVERFQRMVHEELSLLVDGLSDPRLSEALFTINHVQLAPDLGSARVYITVKDGDEKQVLKGLASAASFLRRELGRTLQSKKTPELHFYIDEAQERGDRVEQILREISEEKK
jgi:ribosome-binding factor A